MIVGMIIVKAIFTPIKKQINAYKINKQFYKLAEIVRIIDNRKSRYKNVYYEFN